jgi:hypothetical protein
VIGSCECRCGAPIREIRYYHPNGCLNRVARSRFLPGHNLESATAMERSSKLVPAASLWRLIEQRKQETGMTWRELGSALGLGEGSQDSQLLRLRSQRFIYRWNAERILRALAGMPRPASRFEARLARQIQEREERAHQARYQAERRARQRAS